MPPGTPGAQTVTRSGGMSPAVSVPEDAWATVTVAEALWLLSATLVAMTWKVPALAGAVYTPEPLMVPPGAPSWTDQLTAVDWPPPVPVTEAVKFTMPPVEVEAEPGAMETVMFGAALTLTVAVALFEGSARLVAAVGVVAGGSGAVDRPEPSTLPPLAPSWTDQVTSVD